MASGIEQKLAILGSNFNILYLLRSRRGKLKLDSCSICYTFLSFFFFLLLLRRHSIVSHLVAGEASAV